MVNKNKLQVSKSPESIFEQLIEENKDRIYRICRIYSVSPVEPADLFQEVIFQVWKSLPSFQGTAQISTWIYKIALNVCLRSKMKLERKNHQIIRSEGFQFIDASPVLKEEEEKYQQLSQCIDQLKESDQSIIILYLEDLAYKEIANIIGITENHVAVKMKRIRKKLFDCMRPVNK